MRKHVKHVSEKEVLPPDEMLEAALKEFRETTLCHIALEGSPSDVYLKNRLEMAFTAGWNARTPPVQPLKKR